jgi:ABC-type antimicrobial peptide transport system permease subunit
MEGSAMWDFLSFDTFITPRIIRVVFALGLLVIAIATLISVVIGIWQLAFFRGVILPLIGACVVGLLWRIYCEIILVFFDMRDKLADIATRPRV